MTARGLNSVWFTLLLLAIACTSDDGDSVVSPTMPVSTTEAVALSATTVTTVFPETVVESAVSPESTTTTTVTEIPSTTGPPSDTITSPTATSTTGPTTTTTASTTTLPDDVTVVEVVVREGRVASKDRVDVLLGNRISLVFDSDARLLVHIHGYDEEFAVEAGALTTYEIVGDLPGIFEVEDHVSHRLLLELKVSP